MGNLMECLGQSFLVANLNLEHIDQFKNYRLETGRTSKEGVNKDLVNISTMLNDGVRRGLIPKNPVPRMPKFKVERRLPKFYTAAEIAEADLANAFLRKEQIGSELAVAEYLKSQDYVKVSDFRIVRREVKRGGAT